MKLLNINNKKILKALFNLIIFIFIFGNLINTLLSLIEIQKMLVEYIEAFSKIIVENNEQLKGTLNSILELEKSKNIPTSSSFN